MTSNFEPPYAYLDEWVVRTIRRAVKRRWSFSSNRMELAPQTVYLVHKDSCTWHPKTGWKKHISRWDRAAYTTEEEAPYYRTRVAALRAAIRSAETAVTTKDHHELKQGLSQLRRMLTVELKERAKHGEA